MKRLIAYRGNEILCSIEESCPGKVDGAEGYIKLNTDDSQEFVLDHYTIKNKKLILKPKINLVSMGKKDLKADGESVAIINIDLEDEKGKIVKKDAKVNISSNRGRLSALIVNVKKGQGQFKITSVPETIKIEVSASADGCISGGVDIQLVP